MSMFETSRPARTSETTPMQLPIYLDNHSTTAVDPRVLQAMLPYFTEKYGNAASINHSFGWEAAEAVETAREQIARLVCTSPKSIVFTSGATESNNLALKGVMRAAGPDAHLITNAAEHRAVLDPAKKLSRSGFAVTILPVDQYGLVDPGQIADAIASKTVVVSVMMANNEVGTINAMAEIGRICRERDVLLHCDAAQAVGKLPVDLSNLPVDFMSFTAHKLYGPKGVGALAIRRGDRRIPLEPLIDGGGHERRLRSGTLPVPLIAGFGKACELAVETMQKEEAGIRQLRDRLQSGLLAELDGVLLNGHPNQRLSGNLNVSFEAVDGEALMMSLKDIAVSSGSACTSADPEPSHVLRAMGRSDALTRASLRFGVGRFNTVEEIDFAVSTVVESVKRLRNLSAGAGK
jgi:cysteine desulfurase